MIRMMAVRQGGRQTLRHLGQAFQEIAGEHYICALHRRFPLYLGGIAGVFPITVEKQSYRRFTGRAWTRQGHSPVTPLQDNNALDAPASTGYSAFK
jgi:hypothetical protein